VKELLVTVGGNEPFAWPCESQGVQGVAVDLRPGLTTLKLEGVVVRGAPGAETREVWYAAELPVTVDSGGTAEKTVELAPVAAGITLRPVLASGAITCGQGGVETLTAVLTDWTGRALAPISGDCTSVVRSGFAVPYLPAAQSQAQSGLWSGRWTVTIQGLAAQAVILEGTSELQVQAGLSAAEQPFEVLLAPK